MRWLQALLLSAVCLPLSGEFHFAIAAEPLNITTPAHAALPSRQSRSNGNSQTSISVFSPERLPPASLTLPSSSPLVAPSSSFNSQQFDKQLQRYLRFLARSGSPDILIVGSSRALQGIDPVVLQRTLASRGYPNLRIFNFGVNGATAQLVGLILQKLLTPDQLPHLILWADGVRAFNSGRIDITYTRAIASHGYKLLVAGIRPSPFAEGWRTERPCIKLAPKLFITEPVNQPKYFGFLSHGNSVVTMQQLCWAGLKLLAPPAPTTKLAAPIDDLQETTGFQAVSEQFNPVSYFQHYPKVKGEFDADYRNFSFQGQQTDALDSIIQFTQTRHIPVVFVNLPLSQSYLDEARTTYEQQFRAYLQRHAQPQGLVIHDLSQRWLNRTDYFADPSHLNRYGAAAVAEQIGKILVFPKSKSKGL